MSFDKKGWLRAKTKTEKAKEKENLHQYGGAWM